MINRDTNPETMAQWMQAWTALGRWQALNARLSHDATPLTSGWARRSSANCGPSGVPAGVSTQALRIGNGAHGPVVLRKRRND
jgi:hypothetical protein